MLRENIKALRKAKGLSQQELAVHVHVVRQTISKWEQGLSVPDTDMLMALADALETTVSALLGESIAAPEGDDPKAIAAKLEGINLQLAQMHIRRIRFLYGLCIVMCVFVAAGWAVLGLMKSPYLGWNYSNPEMAVMGVAFHAAEWLFVRVSPFVLAASILGIVLERKKL